VLFCVCFVALVVLQVIVDPSDNNAVLQRIVGLGQRWEGKLVDGYNNNPQAGDNVIWAIAGGFVTVALVFALWKK